MLLDPLERIAVSSVGWVEPGKLWVLNTDTGRAHIEELERARYLSLRQGNHRYFSAAHQYEEDKFAVTVHHFDNPGMVLARCRIEGNDARFEGMPAVWEHVPRHYTRTSRSNREINYSLVIVDPVIGATSQILKWFDGYDKMYQSVLGATEIPGRPYVLIAVQRSSTIILHDPAAKRKVGEISLADRGGNPGLYFRRTANELWADDYDTLLKLDSQDWAVIAKRRLQLGVPDTTGLTAESRQFIGDFTFTSDESFCCVARPFSGDVIALDPTNMKTVAIAKLGRQPMQVAALRDGTVYARDWMSGDLLKGQLK